jgi:hypothetical protein
MVQVSEPAVARCASCEAPLSGRYCARCGEKAADADALTVRHFITHTLGDELAHLDGKFWRTLRYLMFRPGFLTEEYCAGRHVPYIKPIRLLIAALITYALLTQGGLIVTLTIGWVHLSIAPTTVSEDVSVVETVRRIDRFGVLTRALAAKRQSTDVESEAVRVRFHTELKHFAEPLSFANVVLLAIALYVLFRRRRRLFVEHAVFSVHVVSFVLMSSPAMIPAARLAQTNPSLMAAVFLAVTIWQFTYLAIAMRRFYFSGVRGAVRPRLYAVGAALLVYLLNSAFITSVQMLGAAMALRRI